jgi:hypothetical protein
MTRFIILLAALAASPLAARPVITVKPETTITRTCTGYRCIDAGPEAVNVKIERVDWVYGRAGMRFTGSTGVTVRKSKLRLRTPQTGSNLPVGIDIRSGSRFRIEQVLSSGHNMVPVPGQYTNGDGFSTEREADDVTFRWTSATDNSDGGYDLKSTNTVLDGTGAARNGRNYRLWGSGRATTINSHDPLYAHIWAGKTAVWTIDRLVATGGGVLVQVEPGAQLTILSCDLTLWTGTKLVSGASAGLVLGEGCSR